MKVTKEEIVIAAANLFISKGFNATTTAEIAKSVGLCNSGLFSHFKSKEEIYRKVVSFFFLNKQDPNIKFKNVDGTFIDFIDLYIVGVKMTMESLKSFVKDKITSADYLTFMLLAAKQYDDCAQSYVEQDKLLLVLWKNRLQKGIDAGEIRSDIDIELVAKMYMFTFYGSSYFAAFTTGLNPADLKAVYYGYYEMIKNKD